MRRVGDRQPRRRVHASPAPPGPTSSAAEISAPRTPSTRACACGLRTNAMCAIPSSRMSSRNSERPDRIRASSRRRTGRPIDPAAPTTSEGICGKLRLAVKLRLYHHPDGARIAYREAGTGPPLALLHSKGLTHREWEPIVDELAHRHRVVLPDLPLHGASEDRPNHPYSPEWLTELLAALPARHVRRAPAARRPRRRRPARAARDRRRSDPAREARPAAQPDAHEAQPRRARADGADRDPRRDRARLRPRSSRAPPRSSCAPAAPTT